MHRSCDDNESSSESCGAAEACETKKNRSDLSQLTPKPHSKHTQQPAALRLIQLLGAQLDNGADAGDAEAQGAVLNSISACEKCVLVFCEDVLWSRSAAFAPHFSKQVAYKRLMRRIALNYQNNAAGTRANSARTSTPSRARSSSSPRTASASSRSSRTSTRRRATLRGSEDARSSR